ncbi:MAG: PhzF family phenazine biosynthesis protein [Candidatus Schekmanbacteria bacterium]|nr:MAG: PhzF family phenazine biosynthesis protein [Candidatus Schekmanbacteria bacterium]
MNIKLYQIDAFTSKIFSGNPAAVCQLDKWLPDKILQNIAKENNLSETAFFIKENDSFSIRWFTPKTEVKLCGHATLAAGFVIFNELSYNRNEIKFISKSGTLLVSKEEDFIVLDFPVQPPVSCAAPKLLIEGLGEKPIEVLKSEDYIAVFEREDDILSIDPNFDLLKKLPLRGVSITAKAKDSDFVSRFFAPKVGVDEDPVTGSAHCELTPYWANIIKKNELYARQLSERGGEIICKLLDDRVILKGRAVKFMEGEIFLPI